MSKLNKKPLKPDILIKCAWKDCTKTFENEWTLNEHLPEHINQYDKLRKKDFSCPWRNCKAVAKDCQQLYRHVYYHGYYAALFTQGQQELELQKNLPTCKAPVRKNIVPLLESDFKCEWQDCNSSFQSIVEFQDHVVKHACLEFEFTKIPEDVNSKTQCFWNFCKKEFSNKYRLIEHIRTHTSKKLVACPQCGEVFRTKSTLFDHLRRQPDEDTPQKYQCAQCFKYFVTEKLLRVHLLKHINCHKCSMCDMTCSSISSLAVHVRYRHLREKPFKCPECDHRCVRKHDLQKHMQYIHYKNLFRCEHAACNYAVLSASLLKRHQLEVHGKSPFIYICHCCEKPFKSGKSLSYHLMKKHDFQLPSGHKRFKYSVDENGYYRLETMRIESLEVSNQILATPYPFHLEKADDAASVIPVRSENCIVNVTTDFSPLQAGECGKIVVSLSDY